MKMQTLKNITILLTALIMGLGTQTIAASQSSDCHHHHHHHHHHQKNFINQVEESLTEINQSLFFWRTQGGYFRIGSIIIGSVPSANQTNLLNSLKADIEELATSMGNFFTQTMPNPTQAALITSTINQYMLAEQAYEKDVITRSEDRVQSYKTWNTIGRQLAQALAESNPKAELSTLKKAFNRLVAKQSSVIQQLAVGNFSKALDRAQDAIEITDDIGIYLGRAIVLQKHSIDRKNLSIIVPSPL